MFILQLHTNTLKEETGPLSQDTMCRLPGGAGGGCLHTAVTISRDMVQLDSLSGLTSVLFNADYNTCHTALVHLSVTLRVQHVRATPPHTLTTTRGHVITGVQPNNQSNCFSASLT